MNRSSLVNTFVEFLPLNTPDFGYRRPLTESSSEFEDFRTVARNAFANLMGKSVEESGVELVEVVETFFSYELKIKRIQKVNKMEDIEKEMLNWFRQDNPNCSITATLTGQYYRVVVAKGESAIITLGDTLKQTKVREFFENDKNKLPIISGVTDLGEVIMEDAKLFDTMMIAGKPRSGKSWYLLSVLLPMMMFNTPEDVQFIIIDPKESNLFKTLSLMPHVAGLHTASNVLEVMSDIIENEAPRRKRILNENRCDDIWALRKKGVKLPVLYLVIDEYVTIQDKYTEEGQAKTLNGKLRVLISQLPSQGIRLIFIPHRATGIVDKTNRTMLQFTAAVRADNADVIDTLGIKSWNRSLTQPGDIAIKSSTMQEAKYVRSVAITTSDEDNSELIENIAKSFYKMGVDMPNMTYMPVAVNRDEEYVRSVLLPDNRIQYSNSNIFDSSISDEDIVPLDDDNGNINYRY